MIGSIQAAGGVMDTLIRFFEENIKIHWLLRSVDFLHSNKLFCRLNCKVTNKQKYVFSKKCLFSIPIPKSIFPGKGLYYWGYRPRPSKDACSQPHKATARCGGTNGWRPVRELRPKARMLWLLAKSFARCKTNRASNKRHPFLIFTRGFSTAWNLADLFARFCGGNVQKRFRSDNNSVKAARIKKSYMTFSKLRNSSLIRWL